MTDEATITDLELANEMHRVWFTLGYVRRHLRDMGLLLEEIENPPLRDLSAIREFADEGLERAQGVLSRTCDRVFERIDSEKPAWGGVCDD